MGGTCSVLNWIFPWPFHCLRLWNFIPWSFSHDVSLYEPWPVPYSQDSGSFLNWWIFSVVPNDRSEGRPNSRKGNKEKSNPGGPGGCRKRNNYKVIYLVSIFRCSILPHNQVYHRGEVDPSVIGFILKLKGVSSFRLLTVMSLLS